MMKHDGINNDLQTTKDTVSEAALALYGLDRPG